MDLDIDEGESDDNITSTFLEIQYFAIFFWFSRAAFAATNEPTWIAVGFAIGAALGWRKPSNQNEDD